MLQSGTPVNRGDVNKRSRGSVAATVSTAMLCLVAASGMAMAEQVQQTFTSTDTPIFVDDSSDTAQVNVATTDPVGDVNVILNMDVDFAIDISVTLASPNSSASLFSDVQSPNGFSGQYILDDDAATGIQNAPIAGDDVVPGTYATESGSALNSFDGENPSGTWTLTFADDLDILDGPSQLSEFTLVLTTIVAGCGPAGNNTGQVINCDINNDGQVNFDAGGGADTVNINAGTFANNISGGGGSDTINLNDGADVNAQVRGGSGADTFNLFAGGEAEIVRGQGGADIFNLLGANIVDNLQGGSGNDTFNLQSGSVGQQVRGGNNNDTVNIQSSFNIANLPSIDGGSGTDTVNLQGQTVEVANLPTYSEIELTNLQQGTTLQARTGAVDLNSALGVDATSGISMQDDDATDQLTVKGDYTATPGATLAIDAVLTSTGGTADKLVVEGDVNGTTTVNVDTTGSSVGSATPVDIVEFTGGGTGTFVLGGGPLTVGAFEYDLAQAGSVWQLAASGLISQAEVAPTVQSIISGDTREIIGSLADRKGASFSGGREPVADMGNPYSGSRWGTWIRLSGNKAEADGGVSSAIVDGATSYDSTLGFVQAGVSASFWNDGSSRLIASVFGHYSDGDATLTDDAGVFQGTIATISGGVGGSLTWLSTSGFYADLVGLASWHDIDTTSVGATGSTNGDTLAASFELGYSHRVSDTVNVVPQAQLVYQSTSIDGFTDSSDVDIAYSDADHFEGRFGVAVEHVSAMTMLDAIFKANGSVSVLHDFDNESDATVAGTVFGFDAEGTELEIGGGMSVASTGSGFRFGFQSNYTIPLNDAGREGFSLEATAGIDFNS